MAMAQSLHSSPSQGRRDGLRLMGSAGALFGSAKCHCPACGGCILHLPSQQEQGAALGALAAGATGAIPLLQGLAALAPACPSLTGIYQPLLSWDERNPTTQTWKQRGVPTEIIGLNREQAGP